MHNSCVETLFHEGNRNFVQPAGKRESSGAEAVATNQAERDPVGGFAEQR
jgi:hypothetical protein